MIENIGCGFGERVPAEEAAVLWERWSEHFRTNAFRWVRPVQWCSEAPPSGGVACESAQGTSRVWIAICVWKGAPECFVHRPASGATFRMCAPLPDAAWATPRLFAAEMTSDGCLWLDDVADRRLGDWSRRLEACRRWMETLGGSTGWRVKSWIRPSASEGGAESSGLRLLDAPLEGGSRMWMPMRASDVSLRDPVSTVWRPKEPAGLVQVGNQWVSPRFPDPHVYRAAVAGGEIRRCTCVWNARMKCWDVTEVLDPVAHVE